MVHWFYWLEESVVSSAYCTMFPYWRLNIVFGNALCCSTGGVDVRVQGHLHGMYDTGKCLSICMVCQRLCPCSFIIYNQMRVPLLDLIALLSCKSAFQPWSVTQVSVTQCSAMEKTVAMVRIYLGYVYPKGEIEVRREVSALPRRGSAPPRSCRDSHDLRGDGGSLHDPDVHQD